MRLSDFPEPAPDFDLFKRALLRQVEPERIPFFEIQIDPELMAAILGEDVPNPFETAPERIRIKLEQDIKLMHRLGYDYVVVWNMPVFPGNFVLADDTAELSRGMRPWQSESKGPISSREDFDNFMWPDQLKRKYTRFDYVAERLPDGMKIIASLPGPFETTRGLMGITNLFFALHDDPELVADVFARTGELTLQAIESMSKIDAVGGVILAEDIGSKNDLMMSPGIFRDHVLPWHKKMARAVHEHDKLFILHACGKIEKLMDDFISDVEIDGRHSYEDQVTPIEEAKRLYGKDIAVLGGVDMDLLARGSDDEIRRRVREIAAVCAPGGGFGLGTGNSAANYIPPNNYLAMLDEGRKIGL
jgi:uroporphyrinogen decarboxylase